jgi:2-polyprenyl-3-methyl-5-hydroxy-6-metoxy-1,4-benzoquinol methylase
MLHPPPTERELEQYYNNSYEVDFGSYFQGVARRASITLDELARCYPKPGRLLEVGCSYGGFLDQARRCGWDVTGIELSQKAAEYATRELELPVFSSSLQDQIRRLEEPYDVVVMFHVIEHVAEPLALLESCRKLIKPGGLLILKTPNVASSIAKFTGALWHWVSPPAHLYLYSPQTIGKLLHRSGFRLTKLRTSQGDAHNNLFALASGMGRKLFFRSNADSLVQLRRSTPMKIVESACNVLYYPFRLLLDPWLGATLRQPELYAVAVNGE